MYFVQGPYCLMENNKTDILLPTPWINKVRMKEMEAMANIKQANSTYVYLVYADSLMKSVYGVSFYLSQITPGYDYTWNAQMVNTPSIIYAADNDAFIDRLSLQIINKTAIVAITVQDSSERLKTSTVVTSVEIDDI